MRKRGGAEGRHTISAFWNLTIDILTKLLMKEFYLERNKKLGPQG